MDLYSGLGASLRRWAAASARCIAVEASGEAVDLARINAPQATLLRGECATRLRQLDEWVETQDATPALYANPPRSGLEPEVVDWVISRLQPARIAYLSCSAGTLARDLAAFSSAGFEVEVLQPYDFFPNTHHVEVQALLSGPV